MPAAEDEVALHGPVSINVSARPHSICIFLRPLPRACPTPSCRPASITMGGWSFGILMICLAMARYAPDEIAGVVFYHPRTVRRWLERYT